MILAHSDSAPSLKLLSCECPLSLGLTVKIRKPPKSTSNFECILPVGLLCAESGPMVQQGTYACKETLAPIFAQKCEQKNVVCPGLFVAPMTYPHLLKLLASKILLLPMYEIRHIEYL